MTASNTDSIVSVLPILAAAQHAGGGIGVSQAIVSHGTRFSCATPCRCSRANDPAGLSLSTLEPANDTAGLRTHLGRCSVGGCSSWNQSKAPAAGSRCKRCRRSWIQDVLQQAWGWVGGWEGGRVGGSLIGPCHRPCQALTGHTGCRRERTSRQRLGSPAVAPRYSKYEAKPSFSHSSLQ